jgi:hypothetical protein
MIEKKVFLLLILSILFCGTVVHAQRTRMNERVDRPDDASDVCGILESLPPSWTLGLGGALMLEDDRFMVWSNTELFGDGIFDNDSGFLTDASRRVSAFDSVTVQGGLVQFFNRQLGTFSYRPPYEFTDTVDSFRYCASSGSETACGTVFLDIQPELIYWLDNVAQPTVCNDGNGNDVRVTGQSWLPYGCLIDAEARSPAGSFLRLKAGFYEDEQIALKDEQSLVGDGVDFVIRGFVIDEAVDTPVIAHNERCGIELAESTRVLGTIVDGQRCSLVNSTCACAAICASGLSEPTEFDFVTMRNGLGNGFELVDSTGSVWTLPLSVEILERANFAVLLRGNSQLQLGVTANRIESSVASSGILSVTNSTATRVDWRAHRWFGSDVRTGVHFANLVQSDMRMNPPPFPAASPAASLLATRCPTSPASATALSWPTTTRPRSFSMAPRCARRTHSRAPGTCRAARTNLWTATHTRTVC